MSHFSWGGSSKKPVFAGPSGRKPGRKFKPVTGDYGEGHNLLDALDDSVMTTVLPPDGTKMDETGLFNLAAPGRWSNAAKADYDRVKFGTGPVQNVIFRDKLREWGVDPDHPERLTEGRKIKVLNRMVRLAQESWNEQDRIMRASVEPSLDKLSNIKTRIVEWLSRPLVMEKPQGSSLHHVMEWARTKRNVQSTDTSFLTEKFQIFLLEHNWSSAFKGSGDFAVGEIQLPYDFMCFEMRVSGVRVLLMVGPQRDCMLGLGIDGDWSCTMHHMEMDGTLTPLVRANTTTTNVGREQVTGLLALISAQVRAVCIMLDAEVAEVEVRRAPEKLNHQRERQGRTLLRDFHVVRLAHRHRVRAAEGKAADFDPNYTRKRLHFRRGHDRHYPNYKVWIKWQLVGDPDLGFVDKEYRL